MNYLCLNPQKAFVHVCECMCVCMCRRSGIDLTDDKQQIYTQTVSND